MAEREEMEFTRQEGCEGFQSHPQVNLPKRLLNPKYGEDIESEER